MTHASAPSAVTVVGLGAMGRALAGAFLGAGHRITVWNRTPGRAADLEGAGALVAQDPGEAVLASPLTVVCVLGPAAVRQVLDAVGVHVRGRAIVNLTSSVPDDARDLAGRFAQAGARYLDGKIMVPTPLVGTEQGHVLYSGDGSVFAAHAATLRALGPHAELLGDDPGLAALYDLGMLDVFFSGMTAFLHASALVGADGVSAAAFLPYALRVIEVLRHSMIGLARDADRGEYPGEEDNLVMDAAALEHILEASRARGLDTSLPETVLAMARSSIAEGHGADGFSRVIDILRGRASARTSNADAPRHGDMIGGSP